MFPMKTEQFFLFHHRHWLDSTLKNSHKSNRTEPKMQFVLTFFMCHVRSKVFHTHFTRLIWIHITHTTNSMWCGSMWYDGFGWCFGRRRNRSFENNQPFYKWPEHDYIIMISTRSSERLFTCDVNNCTFFHEQASPAFSLARWVIIVVALVQSTLHLANRFRHVRYGANAERYNLLNECRPIACESNY